MQASRIAVLCFAVLSAVIVSGNCGHGGHEGGDGGPAPYKFEYGVHDPHTGDKKSQHEHADGHGHVTGGYTLKEADGTVRVVKYVAEPHKGFRAVVERIGHAHHPAHYGKHKGHGGEGGSSYVATTHWGHGQGGHGGHSGHH